MPGPSARVRCLSGIRVAGYHADARSYTRLLIERPRSVSYEAAREAYRVGGTMRAGGVPCGCSECETAGAPAVGGGA